MIKHFFKIVEALKIDQKSLFPGKITIKSRNSIFSEQILKIAETHFIPEHISLSLFYFSLKGPVDSESKWIVITN